MNYWHMQMHPGDRKDEFPPYLIKDIINKKKIIGLGDSWNNKNGDPVTAPEQFKNEIRVGDIVVIKQGQTPISIVRVLGDAYHLNTVDGSFDWFNLRRKIEILDFYQDDYNFYIPQPRGTLSICNDLSTKTSQVVINWYELAKRKNLMNSINLSDQRIEVIKKLWEKYKQKFSENKLNDIANDIEQIQAEWKKYKDKIVDGTFSIEDYTNRIDKDKDQMPGGYLCNFLERTTKSVFGSSKPAGSALAFGVKLNENGSYSIGKNRSNESIEEANKEFNEKIKPLFEGVALCENAIDKASIFENSEYQAKQILRKLAVLDHMNDFLFIYSDMIDYLHSDFLKSETSSNLAKNHELRLVVNKLLDVKDTPVESVLLSFFLWKYGNTQGLADENSPNVILYGPPGTGKTYEVTNNLDFVCQGEQNRYEMLQFHPSFTYEDFIEGIKPKGVTKDGNIKFELVNGVFKLFCIRAKKECLKAIEKKRDPKPFYFVVDEINRANLSSVFGETLSRLEKDYRHNVANKDGLNLIKTQYSSLIEQLEEDKKTELAYELINGQAYFGVPSNVYFIGMMNDVDKSIDTFDLALRRRFKWIRKDCDYNVISEETKRKKGDDFINIEEYVIACEKLNTYISQELGLGKSYEFGHSFFMKMSGIANRKSISENNIKHLFNLYLKPTLKEYLRALYPESELDAKLHVALDIFKNPFSKK
jgi:hypothetical protein